MKTLLKFSVLILLAMFIIQCSSDSLDDDDMMGDDDMEELDDTMVGFAKTTGTDPTEAANQDRITDNVWITRGNDGGQIYNAKTESIADKDASPAGTLWAIGTLADKDNLTFTPFREAVGKPKDVVGKDLVMQLVADSIFIDIKFIAWGADKEGSFAYNRTKI